MHKEPKEELFYLRGAILEALRTGRMDTDKEFNDLISKTACNVLHKMAEERSYDQQYLALCAEILRIYTLVFHGELKAKRFTPELIVAMTWCFQPNCNLHNNYFQMSDEDIQNLTTKTQVWRNDLKLGDKVDVRVCGDNKNKAYGWLQGEIDGVEDDFISIIFPKISSDFDQVVSRWSNDLMPFESQSKDDYEWRAAELEDAEDACFDVNDLYNWEEATILKTRINVRGTRPFKEAYVAFRVYRNYGKNLKKDAQGRIFDGWTEKFDEWIPVYSPRIQKYMTHAGNRWKSLKKSLESEYDIDDKIKPAEG
jgi:hypothetical protein